MGGDTAARRDRGGPGQGAVHALGQAGQTEQLILGEQAQVGAGAGAASEDPATEAETGGDGIRRRVGLILFMTHMMGKCHESDIICSNCYRSRGGSARPSPLTLPDKREERISPSQTEHSQKNWNEEKVDVKSSTEAKDRKLEISWKNGKSKSLAFLILAKPVSIRLSLFSVTP